MITAEVAAALREPFHTEEIGKLPRITCPDCRDKKCQRHHRNRCDECANYITSAHIHLDYVGHAEVTDRLLAVDPVWTWEPCAWTGDGLPAFDHIGGLWIKLSVSGVTRLGYGHADGKTGGDAVKEVIGDALRNAAMRFGVGLDLWRRTNAAEDPPEAGQQTGADALRREIASMAEAKGYELSTVDSDFSRTMSGADIRTAGAAVLAEYRDRFKGYDDAAAK